MFRQITLWKGWDWWNTRRTQESNERAGTKPGSADSREQTLLRVFRQFHSAFRRRQNRESRLLRQRQRYLETKGISKLYSFIIEFSLQPLASGMDTMMKRPVSALGNRRPMSRFSRDMAIEEPTNPRYRCDNILILELELPTRTTRDWEGPDPDGQGLLSLERGGEPEPDEMVIQAAPGVFRSSSNRQKSSKSHHSSKSSRSSFKATDQNFPKSRGLVPR